MSGKREAVFTFRSAEFGVALDALVAKYKEKGENVTIEHYNPLLPNSKQPLSRIKSTPQDFLESGKKCFEEEDYEKCGERMWSAVVHTVQLYFLENFQINIVSADAATELMGLAIEKCEKVLKTKLLLGWTYGRSMYGYARGCQESLEYDIGSPHIEKFVENFPLLQRVSIQTTVDNLIKNRGSPDCKLIAKKGLKHLSNKKLPYDYVAE